MLHMIKLCVGCDTVEDLVRLRRGGMAASAPWTLSTRQTPKRAAEMVDGGSLYRVFKGTILCRQRILAIETLGEGAAARCQLTLDPEIQTVAPTPRRAFQGWRYLTADDAPPDLSNDDFDEIPLALALRLREAGVL